MDPCAGGLTHNVGYVGASTAEADHLSQFVGSPQVLV